MFNSSMGFRLYRCEKIARSLTYSREMERDIPSLQAGRLEARFFWVQRIPDVYNTWD
jgi:hypothetical protein